MYRLLRPLLFLLPPETAHAVTLHALKFAYQLRLTKLLFPAIKNTPIKLLGLTFKNPVGIAAGLDKNGDYIDALASLGVGFIEVGGVTPKPQPGNPKPRLHRLVKENALINWMGLNNKGIDHLVKNLKRRKSDCIIGVNLAKNKTTPNDLAEQDYLLSLEKIYPYADFAVINVSCPNSSDIQHLQSEAYLAHMLQQIKQLCDQLQQHHHKNMPLFVKIAPDLNTTELNYLIDTTIAAGFDGIVATNTSAQREHIEHATQARLQGGLSGAPVHQKSDAILQQIKQRAPNLPVISVGGIMTAEDAHKRFAYEADLIQLYTGLIYQGPGLIRQILKKCSC